MKYYKDNVLITKGITIEEFLNVAIADNGRKQVLDALANWLFETTNEVELEVFIERVKEE